MRGGIAISVYFFICTYRSVHFLFKGRIPMRYDDILFMVCPPFRLCNGIITWHPIDVNWQRFWQGVLLCFRCLTRFLC